MTHNSNVPRSQEDYISQGSIEIERRVTKKLSQKVNRTENRILGALARLDDFLTNPLIQGHSGTAPETSRNIFSINQATNEDDSQSKPHPEAGIFSNQMTENSGPEDDHDRVTGRTEQIRNRHDMTGFHEEVTYCSPSTSSGKQKKNRSTSQPQFRSENTTATIEADQILLALQQLAKYVKPQSMATAKHKFQKLVFNPANKNKKQIFLMNFKNRPKTHSELLPTPSLNNSYTPKCHHT